MKLDDADRDLVTPQYLMGKCSRCFAEGPLTKFSSVRGCPKGQATITAITEFWMLRPRARGLGRAVGDRRKDAVEVPRVDEFACAPG